MKQSLSFRLAALLASVVITSVLFESVAQLGHSAHEAGAAVASATSVASQL